MPDQRQFTDEPLLRVVRERLSSAWQSPVSLDSNVMPDSVRHHAVVMRVPVRAERGGGWPRTVIVKAHRGWSLPDGSPEAKAGWKRRFNPDARLFRRPSQRYRQEVAGLRFMAAAAMPLAAPRLYATDDECRCVVMEDLGVHDTVLEPLLSTATAEAARGMLALARGMARVQASSVGKEPLFRACGGEPRPTAADWEPFSEGLLRCVMFAREYGLSIPENLLSDARDMRSYFADHPEHVVFSPGDVGPGNQFVIDGEIVLFDFEFSGFRHFALELTNLLLPFPVVWTAAAIPEQLEREMAELYFAEVAQRLLAPDEVSRVRARVFGTAWWAFASVGADLEAALAGDYQWGLASCRERHIDRLAKVARVCAENSMLGALGKLADQLHTALSATWTGTGGLPRYPAFQAGGDR